MSYYAQILITNLNLGGEKNLKKNKVVSDVLIATECCFCSYLNLVISTFCVSYQRWKGSEWVRRRGIPVCLKPQSSRYML